MLSHPSTSGTPVRTRPRRRATLTAAAVGVLCVGALVAAQSPASASPSLHPAFNPNRGYVQTNIVSDRTGRALLKDPNLVNAWGISQGPTTPLWVSDNGADVTTLYRQPPGMPPAIVPLVVSIPDGAPTGQVFNSTSGFMLPNGMPALFIFAGESGTISAWNPTLSPNTAAVKVAHAKHGVFKGLALALRASGPVLLAADFHANKIRVYDSTFMPVKEPSWAFTDKFLPKGYAPFNVADIGGKVFVAYALQDKDKMDDVSGPKHGFIDVYDVTGHLMQRLHSRGVLNSPWGMTIAPAGFGPFAGDLLVGNFGDGRIHALNPVTGHMDGTLRHTNGSPIVIDGLWGLLPGNGTTAPADEVWFSAGPGGEKHGLLGLLSSAAMAD